MVGRSVVLGEGFEDGIGVYCLWVVEVVVFDCFCVNVESCVRQYTHPNIVIVKHNGNDKPYD